MCGPSRKADSPRWRLVMCAEGWHYQAPAAPAAQPPPTHNL